MEQKTQNKQDLEQRLNDSFVERISGFTEEINVGDGLHDEYLRKLSGIQRDVILNYREINRENARILKDLLDLTLESLEFVGVLDRLRLLREPYGTKNKP